jgi:hypothetical protein
MLSREMPRRRCGGRNQERCDRQDDECRQPISGRKSTTHQHRYRQRERHNEKAYAGKRPTHPIAISASPLNTLEARHGANDDRQEQDGQIIVESESTRRHAGQK